MAVTRQAAAKKTSKKASAAKGKQTSKRAASASKRGKAKKGASAQSSRLWLMYPPNLITKPIIWQLGQKFDMVTNVRQASVTGEIGIVCLQLEGDRTEIDNAIKWLERQGIRVEPVEINVIDA